MTMLSVRRDAMPVRSGSVLRPVTALNERVVALANASEMRMQRLEGALRAETEAKVAKEKAAAKIFLQVVSSFHRVHA